MCVKLKLKYTYLHYHDIVFFMYLHLYLCQSVELLSACSMNSPVFKYLPHTTPTANTYINWVFAVVVSLFEQVNREEGKLLHCK